MIYEVIKKGFIVVRVVNSMETLEYFWYLDSVSSGREGGCFAVWGGKDEAEVFISYDHANETLSTAESYDDNDWEQDGPCSYYIEEVDRKVKVIKISRFELMEIE